MDVDRLVSIFLYNRFINWVVNIGPIVLEDQAINEEYIFNNLYTVYKNHINKAIWWQAVPETCTHKYKHVHKKMPGGKVTRQLQCYYYFLIFFRG